jgi:hypothetical protein
MLQKADTEWEKILVKHISYTGLLPQIYKDFLKLNNKKTKIFI